MSQMHVPCRRGTGAVRFLSRLSVAKANVAYSWRFSKWPNVAHAYIAASHVPHRVDEHPRIQLTLPQLHCKVQDTNSCSSKLPAVAKVHAVWARSGGLTSITCRSAALANTAKGSTQPAIQMTQVRKHPCRVGEARRIDSSPALLPPSPHAANRLETVAHPSGTTSQMPIPCHLRAPVH